jgi:hypothetical protein
LADVSVIDELSEPWVDSGPRKNGSTEPPPHLLDIVLAEWSAPPDEDGKRNDDVQVAASWLSPLPPPRGDDAGGCPAGEQEVPPSPASEETVSGAEPAGPDAAPRADASPDTEQLPRVMAYEAATVAVLEEILAAIRDRVTGRMTPLAISLPTAADQTAALAELDALSATGVVAPDQLRARTDRLLALGDACVRLHTLVELRDAGHVTDGDLARRQQTIAAQLAAAMEVR